MREVKKRQSDDVPSTDAVCRPEEHYTPIPLPVHGSPHFPKHALINDFLLRCYPLAEANTPWRNMCDALMGSSADEEVPWHVVSFLNGTVGKVVGLANGWCEARDKEIKHTGRSAAENLGRARDQASEVRIKTASDADGPEPVLADLIALTPETVRALLCRIHNDANILVTPDSCQVRAHWARERLHGAIGLFFSISTVSLRSISTGLHRHESLVATLVCDYGMGFFLHERLLPALRDVSLFRCANCGGIARRGRSTQKRCTPCARKPGVRQRNSRST